MCLNALVNYKLTMLPVKILLYLGKFNLDFKIIAFYIITSNGISKTMYKLLELISNCIILM